MKSETIEKILRELIPVLFLFGLLYGSVAQAFVIPSSSMEPTLQIGDRILINKLGYGLRLLGFSDTLFEYRNPKRNDIVVFRRPDDPYTVGTDESDRYIIKRVIGLPGEIVEVKGKEVFIEGNKLDEDVEQIVWDLGGMRNFGPVKIPEDSVLLLGDNRDHSKDSRFWRVPFLKTSRIYGKAFVRYWPWPGLLE